jgi:hypothetical protein
MSQQEVVVDKEAVKREFDFFLKDYELKTRYISDHLQRMWTRFNFFITIQSALISGKFLFQSSTPNSELIYAGLILSAVWYVFGAQDRFLVDVYRTQAQDAGNSAHDKTQSGQSYLPIGAINTTAQTVRQKQTLWDRVTGWRWEPISITRLAALVPILVFILWLVLLVIQNSR